jgi:hypothetical protein
MACVREKVFKKAPNEEELRQQRKDDRRVKKEDDDKVWMSVVLFCFAKHETSLFFLFLFFCTHLTNIHNIKLPSPPLFFFFFPTHLLLLLSSISVHPPPLSSCS